MSTTAVVLHKDQSNIYRTDTLNNESNTLHNTQIIWHNANASLQSVSDVPVKPHVHERRKSLKKNRKILTATGTLGGVIAGGVVLGPVGMILGGVTGATAVHKVGKIREKKAQRKFEKIEVQKQANQGLIHHGSFA